jgi:hypothetical protein
VLTGSWREDRRGFDDIEEDYNDPTVDRSYADIQLRRYDYHRQRFGYGGEFDFEPNDDHRWYFRANVAGYTESVIKNRLTYDDLTDNPANPDGGITTTTDISLKSTDEQETHRNQIYTLGGVDNWGETTLDYRVSYSDASYHVGKNYGTSFKGPQGLPFTYNNTQNDGDRTSLVADASAVNDPANYSAIKKITNSTEDDDDHEWAYAANLLFPFQLWGDDHIKAGFEVRLRNKDSNPYSYTSTISPLPLTAASTTPVTNFYGRYTNGPQINNDVIEAAYAAGAASGDFADGPLDQSGAFTAREDIYAGYGEYQLQRGPFGAMVGVRVENTGSGRSRNRPITPTSSRRFSFATNCCRTRWCARPTAPASGVPAFCKTRQAPASTTTTR